MKHRWLAWICLVTLAMMIPLEGLAVRYGDVVRITNANAVNVRKGPGTGYSVVGEAQPGNLYVYLGTENGWHHIIFSGNTTGYVSSSRVTIEPGLVPDEVGSGERVEAIVTVTHYNALNVRKGPGQKYGSIGQAKPGSSWTYLGMDDGWNVIDYNGKTGYIAANRTEVEVVDVIAGATTETCDECGGTGKCSTCKGTGTVHKKGIFAICPTCDLTGKCWFCEGK